MAAEVVEKFDLGDDFWVVKVRIGELKEQEINALTMPPKVFDRLSENIRERGGLQSLPLVAQPGGTGPIEIVSGHHRIRAARAAGRTHVWCLLDAALQTRSGIVAQQLAHNALVGFDDRDLVRQLFQRIENPDDRLRSGLADEALDLRAPEFELFTPNLDLEWKTLTFVFLPHQLDTFEELLRNVERSDMLGAVPEEQFRSFLEATAKFAKFHDIRSVGTAIALLTEIAEKEVRDAAEATQ